MLRIIHTSDWHLGHRLHGLQRDEEHETFLAWLLATLETHQIDALLIAGDVFDAANPPAAALQGWYRFLATARRRLPQLDIVITGGNHDSAARLDAPGTVLQALGVHIMGGLPRDPSGRPDPTACATPLLDSEGRVGAWVVAMPYIRMADLPARSRLDPETATAAVRDLFTQAMDAARDQLAPGQALIAMAHCHLSGGAISALSERRVLAGGEHALPADLMPADLAYAALGHLHLAQCVGGRQHIRYSGSPIPLSMSEADYPHQVRLVTVDGPGPATSVSVRVPRTIDLLRVPGPKAAPLTEVLQAIAKLPPRDADVPDHQLPLLEARVRLDAPNPALRRTLEAAVDGRHARLVTISVTRTGDGRALADAVHTQSLNDLRPTDVFLRRWQATYEQHPSDAVMASFAELVELANADCK